MAGHKDADGLFNPHALLVELQTMRLPRQATTPGFSALRPVRAIT